MATPPKETADFAGFADSHWVAVFLDFPANYGQRCLRVAMANRTTFFRRQYRNNPALSGLASGKSRIDRRSFPVSAKAALLPQPCLLYCSPVRLSPVYRAAARFPRNPRFNPVVIIRNVIVWSSFPAGNQGTQQRRAPRMRRKGIPTKIPAHCINSKWTAKRPLIRGKGVVPRRRDPTGD